MAPNVPVAGSSGNISDPNEATLYFNFWPNPSLYMWPDPSKPIQEYPLMIDLPNNKLSPSGRSVGAGHAFDANCDLRAVTLLDCLATIDRFSDFSINIGNNNPDITKLRIPGKINVNTASGDVLRAIPNMTDQMVADVLCYRSGGANAAGYHGTVPSAGLVAYLTALASATPPYVPHGFHSLAELLVPLGTGATNPVINPQNPTVATSRDKAWASVYNLCTVSSDTFVVYGYLEAVQQNPAFPGFNNAAHWYSTGAALVSDDPHAGANAPIRPCIVAGGHHDRLMPPFEQHRVLARRPSRTCPIARHTE